jgi:hypothetical protein
MAGLSFADSINMSGFGATKEYEGVGRKDRLDPEMRGVQERACSAVW